MTTEALFPLAAIAVATAPVVVAVFGRDPQDDQHDLSDYHADQDNERHTLTRDWNGLDWKKADFDWGYTNHTLPPAPPSTNAGGNPLYTRLVAEQVIAQQLRDQYGTTNPATIAETMLRQLAAEQVTR